MEENENQNNTPQSPQSSSAKTAGVLLGLFLNLIGLVIGLLIYTDEKERKEFLSGWIIGFVIDIAVAAIIWIVTYISALNTINSLLNSY